VPTLRTLRLCVFGASLGPHLRALPQLQNLFLEIHPPNINGRALIPKETNYYWTRLYKDVAELAEASATSGSLKRMTWFVSGRMVEPFYKHMGQHTSATSPPTIKFINSSSLKSLSRLSLNLSSQMGTRSFLDAMRGLLLTDLALVTYDTDLLNGTVFREFCAAFPSLMNLRLNLEKIGNNHAKIGERVNDEVCVISQISTNNSNFYQDEFVRGLTSLKHLEAYKGPVFFQRQRHVDVGYSLSINVEAWLVRLLRTLRVTGEINPEALFQWHIWLNGMWNPEEYTCLPKEGPAALKLNE
jgi:hypothetical protein